MLSLIFRNKESAREPCAVGITRILGNLHACVNRAVLRASPHQGKLKFSPANVLISRPLGYDHGIGNFKLDRHKASILSQAATAQSFDESAAALATFSFITTILANIRLFFNQICDKIYLYCDIFERKMVFSYQY
jgi:hypothetical protein